MNHLNKREITMTKLKIINGEVILEETDYAITLEIQKPKTDFDILKININVTSSTNLEIDHENEEESKIDFLFQIEESVNLKIIEVKKNNKTKAQYTYQLHAYSEVEVIKFYDCGALKELDLIELNGEYAKITHKIKEIAKDSTRIDLVIYHNAPNTTSEICNHGVNQLEGSIDFQVTSVVERGIKGCTVNQNNRILSMNDHKCSIQPILLIEEDDITASHAAYIGKFSEEELFYLMSRGIPEKEAAALLIKGFLLDSVPETKSIVNIIEQYWR